MAEAKQHVAPPLLATSYCQPFAYSVHFSILSHFLAPKYSNDRFTLQVGITLLKEMGFNAGLAQKALEVTGNRLEVALRLLLRLDEEEPPTHREGRDATDAALLAQLRKKINSGEVELPKLQRELSDEAENVEIGVKKARATVWRCTACTLENLDSSSVCSLCRATR
jgi:hypothetical protein